ncbi:MAG: Ig-like domain-containing protein [Kofleriaceae bacterium]
MLSLGLVACGFDAGGDHAPPEVVSITPADGAGGVWLHEPIRITFSEPIDPASLSGATLSAAGADIPVTVTAGGEELVVIAGDDAAIVGELRLRLDTRITDLAGNALVETGAVWTLLPWARDERAGEAPAIAVDSAGTILLARSTTAPPRRVIVSQWSGGTWVELGDELGERDAALPSISFDANARPLVVWSELASGVGTPVTPTVAAARWNGAAWDPVASPGEGSFAVLARPADGDPMVAFTLPANNVVRVRLLDGDAWRDLAPSGFDVAVNGTVIGLPQLAALAPAMPVLAFAETGATSPSLRVLKWNSAWSEIAPIALGAPPNGGLVRVSIAARGSDALVGYDTFDGSFGVHAVLVTNTTVRPLGGQLDIDASGNAQAPAVALDADGAPVVAWRELVEGNWRGILARWNGNGWDLLGGHAWNDDPERAIVRPFITLLRDRVPVIAWGEMSDDVANGSSFVRVARWNGPREARLPSGARASIAGCSFDGTAITLSATGCFTISNGRATAHAGLVPFDLVSELWSDGALKRRWIGLPDSSTMTVPGGGTGAWDAPPGTMLVKEFAIETIPGVASSRRVMETRFLLKTGSSTLAPWEGFSFRWRTDGSDADLLPDAASTFAWPVANGQTHTHSYPSRAQCARCHHSSNGPLLGVRSAQLARRFDYDGLIADQLAQLANLGVIGMQPNITPFASPHDTTTSLETRVRGYLAANCSHCHNPTGERATRDFRWETPLAQTMLCGPDNEVVQGMPAASVIVQRISTRVNGMPPIATLQTDPLAIGIMTRWITTETNCP